MPKLRGVGRWMPGLVTPGICCQHMAGTARPADIDYFDCVGRDFRPGPAAESSL